LKLRTVYALAAPGWGVFGLAPCRETLSTAELELRDTLRLAPDIPRLTAEMASHNERAYQEFRNRFPSRGRMLTRSRLGRSWS